jgi:hypothetical protein
VDSWSQVSSITANVREGSTASSSGPASTSVPSARRRRDLAVATAAVATPARARPVALRLTRAASLGYTSARRTTLRRCSSVAEQLFRKQQVKGSNPLTGSPSHPASVPYSRGTLASLPSSAVACLTGVLTGVRRFDPLQAAPATLPAERLPHRLDGVDTDLFGDVRRRLQADVGCLHPLTDADSGAALYLCSLRCQHVCHPIAPHSATLCHTRPHSANRPRCGRGAGLAGSPTRPPDGDYSKLPVASS